MWEFVCTVLSHSVYAVPCRLPAFVAGVLSLPSCPRRSFVAGQLSMVLPALSTLGYKPRPEVRRTIMAQVSVRVLHMYACAAQPVCVLGWLRLGRLRLTTHHTISPTT